MTGLTVTWRRSVQDAQESKPAGLGPNKDFGTALRYTRGTPRRAVPPWPLVGHAGREPGRLREPYLPKLLVSPPR